MLTVLMWPLQVVNGAAYKDGRIRSGDKILAINGQDVSASKQDLVALQLQVCAHTCVYACMCKCVSCVSMCVCMCMCILNTLKSLLNSK